MLFRSGNTWFCMVTRSQPLCFAICLLVAAPPFANAGVGQQIEFFESRIRPVLIERCYHCHNSADDSQGGLALDYRDGLLKGGDRGKVIVAGDPAKSRLIAILKHEVDGLEMPEDSGKLDEKTIADFAKWIKDGAVDPRDSPPSAEDLAKATSWEAKLRERKKWWSFQPIKNPTPPATTKAAGHLHYVGEPIASASLRISHDVDRFIAARLEAARLRPAEFAKAHVLVRRTFFVLIGLPPTPDEAIRWTKAVTANRQTGMTELVDHLLDSPHFGERWARHWMDWIRYAESHGSEGDPRIDNAYHYRDYLIRALNADVPYDQLVREHIAGDLLEQPRINRELGVNESVIGPAHWRMVFHGFAPTDALDEKVRFTDDQINAFSKAFLGLTVSCARCHDHKFDAISQKDYYALFGILGSTRPARAIIDVDSKLRKNHGKLAALKPRIRKALAREWLAEARRSLKQRLLTGKDLWEKADKPTSIMHPWFRLKQGSGEFEKIWSELREQFARNRATREEHSSRVYEHRWRMWDPADYAKWFPRGNGLPNKPQPAGTFALESQGSNIVSHVLPEGVYSHALSSRHAARLTSPTFHLDGEYDMWVRVLGQNGSTVRYVVQNYPRNGTVFPVANLNPQWRWQQYSLKYWDGDDVHIEVTSGKDSPLLVKNNPRSWFGVREAVITKAGGRGPSNDDWSHFDPLMDMATTIPPSSFEDLASHYESVVVNTLSRWQNGAILDSEAAFLNLCVKQGLIDNRLTSLSGQTRELIAEYRRLENEIVEPTRVPGLDETVGTNQRLMTRGNHRKLADEVPRRFLEAIDATPYDTTQSGRRELAEDVLRDDNPLSRRVIVNRIWHHLFGRGIVATPDNLGRMGQQPTHPELLDFLATQFDVELNWSMKSLIRAIVLSRTWQLSSKPSTAARDTDPDNKLLSHANVRRLEAEAIRDSLLTVAGQLETQLFGGPVGGNSGRRSVYVNVIRNSLDPFLRAFDFPEPFSTTGRRDATNVPAQSLVLMNDPAVLRYANAWADRVLAGGDTSDVERINGMFIAAFSRHATKQDTDRIQTYMRESANRYERQRSMLIDLQERRAAVARQAADLVEPVRERLLAAAEDGKIVPGGTVPQPIHRWEFEENAKDVIGTAHADLRGGATLEGGSLVVRNGGHAVTAPLKRSLKAKTLEAWVQLDTLAQRGGGVVTLQTPNGVTFDSIVFAERDAKRWLAGSNNFARTQPFVGAPAEGLANKEPVHVAIAYHADGTVVGYRNGKPYGKPYKSSGPNRFNEDAIMSFGLRHLPAGGNRMLSGRILTAQVYDRALTASEIEATSQAAPFFISEAIVLAQLTEEERGKLKARRSQLRTLDGEIESFGSVPDPNDKRVIWRDLARAMFTFKEFIYLR